MNSSGKDFKAIYRLQDSVLSALKNAGGPFFLTGGTALGRFYLHHRCSEDLDFFCSSNPDFAVRRDEQIKIIRNNFKVDLEISMMAKDFGRIWVGEKEKLKIEWVNDVPYKAVEPVGTEGILLDHPVDILANKLSALLNRDEAKDVADIKTLANNYSFNWMDIFRHARRKALIDEIDVAEKLASFPLNLLNAIVWLIPWSEQEFKSSMDTIVNDFLLGADNSIGSSKPDIYSARPEFRPADLLG